MVHFCISNLQVLYLFLGILVSFEYHQVDLVKTSVSSLASSSAPSVEQVSIHSTFIRVSSDRGNREMSVILITRKNQGIVRDIVKR